MILVDTSVWVDFLKGADSRERRTLHQLIEEEADLSLTGIVLTEILQGVKEDTDYKKLKEHLLAFPVHPPKAVDTYLKAADIYRACRKQGKTVRKTVDCLIAAICLEHDLILFHKDRDFDHIAACTGLKVLQGFG